MLRRIWGPDPSQSYMRINFHHYFGASATLVGAQVVRLGCGHVLGAERCPHYSSRRRDRWPHSESVAATAMDAGQADRRLRCSTPRVNSHTTRSTPPMEVRRAQRLDSLEPGTCNAVACRNGERDHRGKRMDRLFWLAGSRINSRQMTETAWAEARDEIENTHLAFINAARPGVVNVKEPADGVPVARPPLSEIHDLFGSTPDPTSPERAASSVRSSHSPNQSCSERPTSRLVVTSTSPGLPPGDPAPTWQPWSANSTCSQTQGHGRYDSGECWWR